jgi:hypothetical protein
MVASCASVAPSAHIDTRAPHAQELAFQNDGKSVCVTGTLTVIAGNAHFRLTPPPPPGLVDPHNDKIFVWPFAEIQRRGYETGDTPTFCGRIRSTGYHGSFDLRVTRWDQD